MRTQQCRAEVKEQGQVGPDISVQPSLFWRGMSAGLGISTLGFCPRWKSTTLLPWMPLSQNPSPNIVIRYQIQLRKILFFPPNLHFRCLGQFFSPGLLQKSSNFFAFSDSLFQQTFIIVSDFFFFFWNLDFILYVPACINALNGLPVTAGYKLSLSLLHKRSSVLWCLPSMPAPLTCAASPPQFLNKMLAIEWTHSFYRDFPSAISSVGYSFYSLSIWWISTTCWYQMYSCHFLSGTLPEELP